MTFRLYVLQRLTALLMTPLILAHIAMILYASGAGLSAAEILGRTRGSVGWGLFYGVFVLLAAIHGAIGVRNVLSEWTDLPARALDLIVTALGLLLLLLGWRAVYAVVIA
jgi:fumarate reductase subunit C